MARVDNNQLISALANASKWGKNLNKQQATQVNSLLKRGQAAINAGKFARNIFKNRPSLSAQSSPISTGATLIHRISASKAPVVTPSKNSIPRNRQSAFPINNSKKLSSSLAKMNKSKFSITVG